VQWYDPDDPKDPWKHNKIQKEFGNDLQNIDEKKGLWIHITKPGGAELICFGDTSLVNPQIPLKKGWNLVGYPSLSGDGRPTGLNNIQYDVHIDIIQWYDASTKSWHEMGPEDTFVTGRGYWFHTTSDCVWEVPK
jgi:hypothetical protein